MAAATPHATAITRQRPRRWSRIAKHLESFRHAARLWDSVADMAILLAAIAGVTSVNSDATLSFSTSTLRRRSWCLLVGTAIALRSGGASRARNRRCCGRSESCWWRRRCRWRFRRHSRRIAALSLGGERLAAVRADHASRSAAADLDGGAIHGGLSGPCAAAPARHRGSGNSRRRLYGIVQYFGWDPLIDPAPVPHRRAAADHRASAGHAGICQLFRDVSALRDFRGRGAR